MSNQKAKETLEQEVNTNQQELSFAEQVAQALLMAQQATNAQQAEEKRLKDFEQKMRSIDIGGVASMNFTQRMEQEIADGNYVAFKFWPAMAKRYTDNPQFTVSGYTISFAVNQVTKVPNSLVYYVEKIFGGDMYSMNPIPNFVVSDRNTGAVDRAASQQVAEGVASMLAADGIRFR